MITVSHPDAPSRSRMFSGFRSRCSTPFSCSRSRLAPTDDRSRCVEATSPTGMKSSGSIPSMRSMAIHVLPSRAVCHSHTFTTPSNSRPAMSEASRRNRLAASLSPSTFARSHLSTPRRRASRSTVSSTSPTAPFPRARIGRYFSALLIFLLYHRAGGVVRQTGHNLVSPTPRRESGRAGLVEPRPQAVWAVVNALRPVAPCPQ